MVILVRLVVTLHEPMCNQESAHFRNQPSRLPNGMTKIRYDRFEGPIRDRVIRFSTLSLTRSTTAGILTEDQLVKNAYQNVSSRFRNYIFLLLFIPHSN